MPDENQIGKIFKDIDSTILWELGAILVAVTAVILLVQRILPWVANRLSGRKRLYTLAAVPFIRLLILLTAFLMAVPLLIEPSLQNMVALLGSVGLALGFALKDYASSLIAGVVAIGEQNYRNGDWVRVGDIYGEVRNVGMRTFEIVTQDDDRVLMPHNLLWNQSIINSNNGDPRLQCTADFYLHPQHDARTVRQVLEDVAMSSPYLYFDEPIAVVVKERPWATHYRLKAYPLDAAQQFRFTSDLTVRGKAALLALGVNFSATCSPPVSDA